MYVRCAVKVFSLSGRCNCMQVSDAAVDLTTDLLTASSAAATRNKEQLVDSASWDGRNQNAAVRRCSDSKFRSSVSPQLRYRSTDWLASVNC